MDKTKQKSASKVDVKQFLLEENESTIEELLGYGVHFGHKTQKWHPSMKQYIYTQRDGIHIIDLIQTINKINEALTALGEYAKKGEILFVGTKPQAKESVKSTAIKTKSHFICNRWPGGLLTNFDVTLASIKKLAGLRQQFQEGIQNRTKKEMLQMKKELERLEYLYAGVKQIKRKPACLIVVDPKNSRIAVREAYQMNIPVIALVDTNSPVKLVTHVIPTNDDSVNAINFVINKLGDVVLHANEGRGVDYDPVDFKQIDQVIENMSQVIQERKNMSQSTNRPGQQQQGGPKTVRVSREDAKRFHKAIGR